MGVEIFPGFAAAEILFNEDGSVKGVATGDMGVARDGSHKPDYQPGMELHGRYTFFAEGARGHLTKELSGSSARDESGPQVYGIGLKELWDDPAEKHEPGRVIHTQGWPLDDAWGGGFLYHQANNQVALGFVVALDYRIPGCRRSRNSSAGSSIRRSAPKSKAAAASPTARARSTRAAGRRCRSSLSPAAR